LHKKGYTDRQIAEELRMSSRDIVKVRKENEREEKKQEKRKKKKKLKKKKRNYFRQREQKH
jgi:hypothetical protein